MPTGSGGSGDAELVFPFARDAGMITPNNEE